MMPSLGNLEETLLLLVLIQHGDAYGVSITEAYTKHTGKGISIPAVHTVLKRLEKKGLLSSHMGGATSDRGGRRKRLFEITALGHRVLTEVQDSRKKLWEQAPKLDFN